MEKAGNERRRYNHYNGCFGFHFWTATRVYSCGYANASILPDITIISHLSRIVNTFYTQLALDHALAMASG